MAAAEELEALVRGVKRCPLAIKAPTLSTFVTRARDTGGTNSTLQKFCREDLLCSHWSRAGLLGPREDRLSHTVSEEQPKNNSQITPWKSQRKTAYTKEKGKQLLLQSREEKEIQKNIVYLSIVCSLNVAIAEILKF